ncbi:unnamed protein product [Darwinula stevensoni]|uniref:Proliferation-associated SNF2-like protein n=1 Tax=Darwinula stevensoni TaxID=69355 RepID=A0A7R8WXN5_9CRUS|nr:unnamed protein product [Darwinula stevensoni]CAG0878603.1 unnamed protein product [Darwinula stevensoni]
MLGEAYSDEDAQNKDKTRADSHIQLEGKFSRGKSKELEVEEEKRYMCLMNLLDKSKKLASFLEQKLDVQGMNVKQTCEPKGKIEQMKGDVAKGNSAVHQNIQEHEAKRKMLGKMEVFGQCNLFEGGKLRPYQVEGVEWLNLLFLNGTNGILADEMGLGKTVQCIAFISHLIENSMKGPFLVVAPLSTLPNWLSEFQQFTPKLKVVLYHGAAATRKALIPEIKKQHQLTSSISSHPVVLTSYDIIIRDAKILRKFSWAYCMIDEGHRLKNFNCRLVRELHQFHFDSVLILTGTPLQNNLEELWALLNFILPDVFHDLQVFQSWFQIHDLISGGSDKILSQEKEKKILTSFHQILSPFILRRLKVDVEIELPAKKELLIYCPLTEEQFSLYSAVLDGSMLKFCSQKSDTGPPLTVNGKRHCKGRNESFSFAECDGIEEYDDDDIDLKSPKNVVKSSDLSTSPVMENKENSMHIVNMKLNNRMMMLRKIANHPYLVRFPLNPQNPHDFGPELIAASGKLLVLDELLHQLKKQKHKVLIFSQMTRMMDILADYLDMRGFGFAQLDGRMSLDLRQEMIKRFNSDVNTFVFLISTRAGGLGLNLTAADTVVIYDSDWNPQQDLQAQDRCHRIGQSKPVVVYRLVTVNTIDEEMVERASAKRRLEKIIMKKEKFDSIHKGSEGKQLNLCELEELMKSSDFHGVAHPCSSGKVFTDEQLKSLLDRDALFQMEMGTKQSSGNCAYKVLPSETALRFI